MQRRTIVRMGVATDNVDEVHDGDDVVHMDAQVPLRTEPVHRVRHEDGEEQRHLTDAPHVVRLEHHLLCDGVDVFEAGGRAL